MIRRIAEEIGVLPVQVSAVEKLLGEGCTVPFIARYRKEAHGNLDEVKIGKVQERLSYYRELDERKRTIIKTIDEQGKLTDELREKIEACFVKSHLEDLYAAITLPKSLPNCPKTDGATIATTFLFGFSRALKTSTICEL